MSNRIAARTRSETLASHILPISATMIGVCATLIGLVKLAEQKLGPSHVDEYAALAAVTFLASALASYLSIRSSDRPTLSTRIERIDRALATAAIDDAWREDDRQWSGRAFVARVAVAVGALGRDERLPRRHHAQHPPRTFDHDQRNPRPSGPAAQRFAGLSDYDRHLCLDFRTRGGRGGRRRSKTHHAVLAHA